MTSYNKHAIRALIIIVSALALGLAARAAMVPASWGQFGPYRADHLFEAHSQEPLIQDIDYCIDCHEKEWDMADGKHGAVPCEDCHQSPSLHAVKHEDAPSDDELLRTEAQATARLSFQSILAVMRQGWNKQKIDQFMALLNDGKKGVSFRLFRGAGVARQFGQRDGQAQILEKEPEVRAALADGKERLLADKENVRYIYPLIAQKECLECHTASALGEVNGALEVDFTVAALALKRHKKLAAMSVDRSREACQICHERIAGRPKSFPQVDDFNRHITKGWKTAMGQLNTQARCVTCHKAHFPSMVKSKES